MAVRIESVLGQAHDPGLAEPLHELAHQDLVEYITLPLYETARRRLRARSDAGREYEIAIPRSQRLSNGSVLLLETDRAVVVRVKEQRWLRLTPNDGAAALELGYLAGNMHWRVRFEAGVLLIAVESEEAAYLARLAGLLDAGRVRRIDG